MQAQRPDLSGQPFEPRIESRWVQVRGLSVHARVSAPPRQPAGPSVILVHGVGVSSRYMVPTARVLARDLDAYAPDLPGFGRTAKPRRPLTLTELAQALGEWTDAVGLHRPAYVGNSFGCQILVELAVRRPELVDRLVLQGPTIDPWARTWPRQLWRWLLNTPHERPSQGPLIVMDYWEAGLARTIRTFGHALADRIEDKLPRVEAPALVVRGERDPIVPQRWAREVARLLPRGRLVVIPGAAHTLNYAAPEEFGRAILPFLREGSISLP